MLELRGGERVDRLVAVLALEQRLDPRELVALVLLHRADGAEARQLELARRRRVPGGEMAHEVLRDGDRLLGIARRPEPDLPLGAVDEEHVEVLVHTPDVRDRDAERLERPVHLGLAREAHERARRHPVRRVGGTADAPSPVDGHVDREAAPTTAGDLDDVAHLATRGAFDPHGGRGVDSRVRHGRSTPGASTRATSR